MADNTLRAGAAELNITPPMGVEMCGYGPNERRVCTEVLDPLYARALWLESGETALALITADLCTVDLTTRDEAAQAISKASGIPPENVMIAASHTHSGPSAQLLIAWGERDPQYVASLPERFARVALEARGRLEPARAGACRRRVVGVGVNREQGEFGPLDPAAQMLRVDRADGAPLAAVFNFGAHAVTRYPYTSRISADWPGLAAACISFEMKGAPALFLQGPCGNINGHHMSFARTNVDLLQRMADMRAGSTAERLCDQILPALKGIETKVSARLGAAWKIVQLPCVRPDRAKLEQIIAENLKAAESMKREDLRPLHERILSETPREQAWRNARYLVDSCRHQLKLLDEGEDSVAAPLHVLRVGDAAIVGWPGEIFVELGIELRQRSPVPLTFVASVANHSAGYVPTPAAYESQGRPNQFGVYPTFITPRIYGRLPFRSDVGNILIAETLEMLRRP